MTWRPSFLVSYVAVRSAVRSGVLSVCDEWVLDSGAYSALTSGKRIDLAQYIDDCHALLRGPHPPSRIFALDVIGDPEASARNTEEMRRQGIDAIATFHYGSPWHYLKDVAKPGKCAFGGMVARAKGGFGVRLTRERRLAFLEECFARAWPVWSHGFGCCDAMLLSRLPLASVDATSWIFALSRYGNIQYLQGLNNSGLRASKDRSAYNSAVRGQIDYFRRMESEAQAKWGSMLSAKGYGTVRLRYALSGSGDRQHFEDYLRRHA
jgi:hypothetical protein